MVAPSACEPGKDTPVIFFASPPLSARSATAFGRPFALRHGSRLFTLRSFFVYSPAVPFSTSPARRKVFTRLAWTSCPSRIRCSLCPAFQRLSFSRPSFPKTARVTRSVLVRSNNRLPLWATAIRPQAETACVLLHSTGSGFLSPLVARVPFRVADRARTPSVEPVNPASWPRLASFGFEGPNQPAWFNLSPVARDYL
jgi:hypothetical protein